MTQSLFMSATITCTTKQLSPIVDTASHQARPENQTDLDDMAITIAPESVIIRSSILLGQARLIQLSTLRRTRIVYRKIQEVVQEDALWHMVFYRTSLST